MTAGIKSAPDGKMSLRIVVSGRVQGVWFRGWMQQEADARGLDGWVRNRRDGTVEAVLCGEEAVVADMLAVCRVGPPAARVTGLESVDHDAPVARGFLVRPSG